MITIDKINQFFNKHIHKLFIILFVLFIFENIQSCNRGVRIESMSNIYNDKIDSLQTVYDNYYKQSQDSIIYLNFQINILNTRLNLSDEKSRILQTAVDNLDNRHTTVIVREFNNRRDTIF